MLKKVKAALRITIDDFDDELYGLIDAAMEDLEIAGVRSYNADGSPLVQRAVITYCKLYWGDTDGKDYDRLKAAYDEQKAQLMMATGYTNWGLTEG